MATVVSNPFGPSPYLTSNLTSSILLFDWYYPLVLEWTEYIFSAELCDYSIFGRWWLILQNFQVKNENNKHHEAAILNKLVIPSGTNKALDSGSVKYGITLGKYVGHLMSCGVITYWGSSSLRALTLQRFWYFWLVDIMRFDYKTNDKRTLND